MNYKFCPQGHTLFVVPDSLLGPESFYCEECDKIYQPVLQEADLSEFSPERADAIKELALILDARRKITKADLIKLGKWKHDTE
jgi:hypothetical protein